MHLKQSQYFQGVTLFVFPFNLVKFSGFNAYKTRKNESLKGTRKLIRILTLLCTALSLSFLFVYIKSEKQHFLIDINRKLKKIMYSF